MRNMRKLITVLASTAALAAIASGNGGAPLCDAGLGGNQDSAIAYQLRGDRCEGIYKLEVNSTQLRLSSVVESFEPFDASKPEDLTVQWSAPADLEAADVRLRAESLRPRTFYRMDTVVPGSQGAFSWKLDIVDRLGYSREDLGVLGWIRNPETDDDDRRQIYLPLRIRQGAATPRTGTYEVAFIPEVRLEEVYFAVTPVNAKGEGLGPRLYDTQELGYGYYPSKTPTSFEITGFTQSGFYEVEIKAVFFGGDSGTTSFLLYHEE